MELKPKIQTYKGRKVAVRLTDVNGDTKDFDSIGDALVFLGVTRMALYNTMKNGTKCRGCIVERI